MSRLSWTEQLLNSWTFHSPPAIVGLAGPQSISHSNKSLEISSISSVTTENPNTDFFLNLYKGLSYNILADINFFREIERLWILLMRNCRYVIPGISLSLFLSYNNPVENTHIGIQSTSANRLLLLSSSPWSMIRMPLI